MMHAIFFFAEGLINFTEDKYFLLTDAQ